MLSILIPQYNEDERVIKPLLDSIAIQQNIDFKDIEVIICNDGSDVILSREFLDKYNFKIDYHLCPHRGVSATRNACFDASRGNYVIWCDADDMFYTPNALYIIFNEMDDKCDGIIDLFMEESKQQDRFVYIPHENDSTFVHGKVWRRQHLIDNNIKFNPDLTIHEDSYFNILARVYSKDLRYCHIPFYLWKWRDESVCRHDPKYILKTYPNLIDTMECLTNRLKDDNSEQCKILFVSFVYETYYLMNKPEWIEQENQEYRTRTEKMFKRVFVKYKDIFDSMNERDRMLISNQQRQKSILEGMVMENITFDDWIEGIEE